LVEQEAVDGSSAWAPADFLAAARKAVWRELDAGQVTIDAYRRNLQRSFLDVANTKINGAALAASGDEKPFYRAELRALSSQIAAALAKTSDRETKAHLEGARDQIAHILDPKFNQTNAAPGAAIRVAFDGFDPAAGCWPDYVIRAE